MRVLLDEEIEESFDQAVLDRGRNYLRGNRVLDLNRLPDGSVKASVKGTRERPYTVHLELNGSKVRTQCTCTRGEQCKHGAAAALRLRNSFLEHPHPEAPAPTLPYELRAWLEGVEPGPDPLHVVEGTKQRLCYLLELTRMDGAPPKLVVSLHNQRVLGNGVLGVPTRYNSGGIANGQFQRHVNAFDRELLADLHRNAQGWYGRPEYELAGPSGARLLEALLATGRCYLDRFDTLPLQAAPPRRAALGWRVDARGNQAPHLEMEGECAALPVVPPYYVDLQSRACGAVECEADPSLVAAMLRAPAVPPEFAPSVREGLLGAGVPVAWVPEALLEVERVAPTPVPHLQLELVECEPDPPQPGCATVPVPFARLSFDYEGQRVAPSDRSEIRRMTRNRVRVVARDQSLERGYVETLESHGWSSAAFAFGIRVPKGRGASHCLRLDGRRDSLEQYDAFLRDTAPALRRDGWVLEVVGELEYVGRDEVRWELAMDAEPGKDWFELALGVRVGETVVDLRDVLLQVMPWQALAKGRRKGDPEPPLANPIVRLPGGRILTVSPQRLEALLAPLRELFGELGDWPKALRLPVARLGDADRVEALADAAGAEWRASKRLEKVRRRLAERGGVRALDAPEGFVGELRGYQREGLAWLQFLREFGFGGVLADDMGLGKTVQVLAHLQTERLAGRHDRPSLVVAPTSTLPNWRREAARFVPDLKVATLHGPDRDGAYEALDGADLALTNYALLARDREKLAARGFHLLVLDEAQNVKNATTEGAKAARALEARHRLCLSGTPVENHLDELWSLFEFLMPGFLGSQRGFRREFRTPIEKRGDEVAQARLSARVRPFLLRRTKQQVAKELPPKTEIVESVEFGDAQRDLYELVRVAVDKRLRALLARQGLDKSRIHVLDALLKLRQVCCDPRLVKLESARGVDESAKLERLFEMLPVLLEEGRRVLLFSQFTSMLDLIEPRLREAGIPWVRISGDTLDRDTPVQRFQGGEVPLFLISLKAGGTGLNLVAADTVIHYDPWWNPAVERQATDRAHRIGQDKAVMVYKFVAAGTVEEKILELQERKAGLAEAILDGTENALAALAPEDLEWLLGADGLPPPPR